MASAAEGTHVMRQFLRCVLAEQPSDVYAYARQYFAGLHTDSDSDADSGGGGGGGVRAADADGEAETEDVLVFTGPPGIDVQPLLKTLVARFPAFQRVVSHTSRTRRANEVPGLTYHFTSLDTFNQLAASGVLLDHASVGKDMFGTSRVAVETVRQAGLIPVVWMTFEGMKRLREEHTARVARRKEQQQPEEHGASDEKKDEISGAETVTEMSPCAVMDGFRFVFLQPSSVSVLEQRLRGRGVQAIESRLEVARQALQYATESTFDAIVECDDGVQSFEGAVPWLQQWYPARLLQTQQEQQQAKETPTPRT